MQKKVGYPGSSGATGAVALVARSSTLGVPTDAALAAVPVPSVAAFGAVNGAGNGAAFAVPVPSVDVEVPVATAPGADKLLPIARS